MKTPAASGGGVLPTLAAAATGVQVGAALVATRFVVDQSGPISLALLRYIVGFLCLLPFVLLAGKAARIGRRDLIPIALIGVVQFGGVVAVLNFGLQYIPAGRAALIFATFPLITMLLAAALGHERLTFAKSAGVLLTVAGVGVALGDRALERGGVPDAWIGELAVLFSAFCGAGNLEQPQQPPRRQPRRIRCRTRLRCPEKVLTEAPAQAAPRLSGQHLQRLQVGGLEHQVIPGQWQGLRQQGHPARFAVLAGMPLALGLLCSQAIEQFIHRPPCTHALVAQQHQITARLQRRHRCVGIADKAAVDAARALHAQVITEDGAIEAQAPPQDVLQDIGRQTEPGQVADAPLLTDRRQQCSADVESRRLADIVRLPVVGRVD